MNIEMKCGGKRDRDFLRLRLRCVLACAGKDPVRPALRKVLVEKVKGGVAIVATDGTRLRKDFFAMRAAPGLYDIGINTAKDIRLEPSSELVRYPEYKKAIPSCGEKSVYVVNGKGPRFVMWVCAALGTYVVPKLMALGDEEKVDVFIQKNQSGMSPVVVRNEQSLLVVMPMTMGDDMAAKIDHFQRDQQRHHRKAPAAKPKPRPKARPASWWLPASARRKAA